MLAHSRVSPKLNGGGVDAAFLQAGKPLHPTLLVEELVVLVACFQPLFEKGHDDLVLLLLGVEEGARVARAFYGRSRQLGGSFAFSHGSLLAVDA
jgi:hypothetical protein